MGQSFTLIEEGRAVAVDAVVGEGRVVLSASDVESKLGWTLKPQGLCRGEICVPVAKPEALHSSDGIDLAEFARLLGRPLAIDTEEGAAALAEAPSDRRAALTSLDAPDFTASRYRGKLHSLSEHRGRKFCSSHTLLGEACREDLPVWQALYEELGSEGFVPITVALDRCVDDPRPLSRERRRRTQA